MANKQYVEDAKQRYDRYRDAADRQDYWQDLLQEAYNYAYPLKNLFRYKDRSPGVDKMDHVFDATALIGLVDYANNLESLLFPPGKQWAFLEVSDEIDKSNYTEQEIDEIKEKIQEANETIFKYIENSNLAQARNEAFMELGISTGVMILNEGTQEEPLEFSSVALANVAIEEDGKGNLSSFWRRWDLTPRQIRQKWADIKLPASYENVEKTNPNKTFELIEGTIYYPENEPGSQYFYYVSDVKTKEDMLAEFREYSPWIGFRSTKAPNEVYGTGPILLAMPFIRMINKLTEYMIRGVKLRVFPIIMVQSDDLNAKTLNLEPGSIVNVPMAINGQDPIKQLQIQGDPQYGDLTIQELKRSIQKILYSDPLPDPQDSPNQSATEARIRADDWSRRNSSSTARVSKEYVTPLFDKSIRVLKRKGILNDIIINNKRFELSLANNLIKLTIDSPVIRMQKVDEVQKIQEWYQGVLAIIGPQLAPMAIEMFKLPRETAEMLDIPLELVKSEQEMQQMVQKTQQQIQQTQQQMQAAQPQNTPQQNQQQMQQLMGG